MTKMTKRDFITSVSKRTNLRRDVVEDVFDGIVDTAIEEIINTGEFTMKDLFSITSRDWKGYSLAGTEVKPQKRLSVRLSEKIKEFWKIKNEFYPNIDNFTRSDLEKARKHHQVTKESSLKRTPNSSEIPKNFERSFGTPTRQKMVDDFNPLLDEED